jgi:outer membrane protein TolC
MRKKNNPILSFFSSILLLLIVIVYSNKTSAQENSGKKRVVTYNSFISQILQSHPVAAQAALLNDMARQQLRLNKGLLDPTVNSKYATKSLDQKDYYFHWTNDLKIPLWWGTDIKASYTNVTGEYASSEDITPSKGLSAVGITIPLGQGLIIDERRNAIKQAQIMQKMADVEKIKIINKLILQANKDYNDWLFSYRKMELFFDGYKLANLRLKALKERVIQGDLPSIDSVEANIEAQNRYNIYLQSMLEYQNGLLIVSNYLWSPQGTPLEMDTTFVPETFIFSFEKPNSDSLNQLLTFAQQNHPDLVKLELKLDQLGVEKKLFTDKLKPKLNLEYNFLGKGLNLPSTNTFANDNYKFGASFSYPLFLRQERGKLAGVKLKITDTKYNLQQNNLEIRNSIKAAYNETNLLAQQIAVQTSIVSNAVLMRNGELAKFESGESSIFLINTREMSLLNHSVKLAEMQVKFLKAQALLKWSAGKMP